MINSNTYSVESDPVSPISRDIKQKLFLSSLIDNVSFGIVVLKAVRDRNRTIKDFKIILVNRYIEKATGKYDLKGKNLLETFPGINSTGLFRHYAEITELGNSWHDEVQYDYDGYSFWKNVTASKFSDGCLVVFHDISEEKRAREEIRKKNNELLENIFEALPMPVSYNKTIRNNEGKVIDFTLGMMNGAMLDFYGLKKDSAGKTLKDLFPGIETQPFWDFMLEASGNNVSCTREIYCPYSSPPSWQLMRIVPFQNGILVSGIDISERKMAEIRLQESNHFIRQITETTPDLLLVWDVETAQIIYFNKKTVRSLGYTAEEIFFMKKDILQIVHPGDRQTLNLHIQDLETIIPGEIREIELRASDREGNWQWYNCRYTHFMEGEKGSLKQVFAVCSNITEKKNAEAAFIKEQDLNSELRRINELLDTFVYAAAHDLKEPASNLKILNGMIESMPDKDEKIRLQQKYHPIVDKLENAINGIIKVLEVENNVTGISRINFYDSFNTVMNELEENIRISGAGINHDFSACESLLYIEPFMTIIFRNLLSNAIKYRSEGRNLSIGVRTEVADKFVLISFSDNGIGIDLRKHRENLFKPFRRFHSVSSGNGIGLYLIKNIVCRNGGRIEVDSTPGRGTCFRIFLSPYMQGKT